MLTDVWKRPFILVGAAAFLTMSLLALTSTHGWMRRLGAHWQRLHRLIHLIGVLAILHYWWHKAGKNDLQTVMIYAAVLAALLLWRVVRWRLQRSRALLKP
jgi:sulfoxide reductase heme-binding subunit YedZ